MKDSTVGQYLRDAEAYERGPQYYGGDAAIAGLRAFRAYHPDAHIEFVDCQGVMRWMTSKQSRIYAILMRQAVAGQGLIKMREIGKEARVCASTVSRAVLKFQAWGMFGAIVVRGRKGGMYVFARTLGDTLGVYADMARARLARLKLMKVVRAVRRGLNVAPVYLAEDEGAYTDATFSESDKLSTFTRAVAYERARLAYTDPEGEKDAVSPLTRDQAWMNMMIYAPIKDREPSYNETWAEALGMDPTKHQGRVPCPAHGEGRSKTLSWKRADDGRLLLHCFAGCSYEEIRAACR